MPIVFSELRHLPDLARALGTTVDNLERFTKGGDAQRQLYTAIRLAKKGKKRGQYRTVFKAVQDLRLLHKSIATAIADVTEFEDHVQGFVNKRSIVTNARVHLGQKVLLHADIHHFFETISAAQVETAFQSLGCVKEVVAALTAICTLDGCLPEGSSASPIIANLVSRFLDADLKNLARAHGCRFTRYADDITISGDLVPEESAVETILTNHGFQLRDGKCRIQRRGRSQYVTGLTVADSRSPRIPRVMKRRLRLELYYAHRFSLEDHLDHVRSERTPWQEVKRLGGWISFMSSAEGRESTQRLHDWWRQMRVTRTDAVKPPDDD